MELVFVFKLLETNNLVCNIWKSISQMREIERWLSVIAAYERMRTWVQIWSKCIKVSHICTSLEHQHGREGRGDKKILGASWSNDLAEQNKFHVS